MRISTCIIRLMTWKLNQIAIFENNILFNFEFGSFKAGFLKGKIVSNIKNAFSHIIIVLNVII